MTLLERLLMVLRGYCERNNSRCAPHDVVVEAHRVDEFRGVVTAEHFLGMQERHAHLWEYLRQELEAEELVHISCIQTLAPGEEAFPWRD